MVAVASINTTIRIGDRIDGRYRGIDLIADGGMGTVFLCEHVLIKRRVAVKVLHRDLAHDVLMVQRFLNEASAAGTLGHPNIVESTDMGFTPDQVPFIEFEYLDGHLLTKEVYRVGGLPVRRALRIATQIASALDAAHAAGIVHLDLKSDNVFLVEREGTLDHVKVLDFGIARFLGNDLDRAEVAGTPEFMAPEQLTSPAAVDERTDVYALGVVLYEMLPARRPFDDENQRALLHRIVYEPPPALDRGLPEDLKLMISSKLAKERSARSKRTARSSRPRSRRALGRCTSALRRSPRPRCCTARSRRMRRRCRICSRTRTCSSPSPANGWRCPAPTPRWCASRPTRRRSRPGSRARAMASSSPCRRRSRRRQVRSRSRRRSIST